LKPKPTARRRASGAWIIATIAASSMLRHSSFSADPNWYKIAKIAEIAKSENSKPKLFNYKGHPFDSPLARSGQATERRMASVNRQFGVENSCFRGLFVL
jgi:hypothetical protein